MCGSYCLHDDDDVSYDGVLRVSVETADPYSGQKRHANIQVVELEFDGDADDDRSA